MEIRLYETNLKLKKQIIFRFEYMKNLSDEIVDFHNHSEMLLFIYC